MTDRDAIEAVVLTGGLAQRLQGAVKGEIDVGCGPILTGELDAVRRAGIRRAIVVGPGPLRAPSGLEIAVTREDPPFGGPTAALAAALPLARAPWLLLLACDLPGSATLVSLLTEAWDELTAAPSPAGEGAIVVDRTGRPQWLAGVYARGAVQRELDRASDEAEPPPCGARRDASVGRVLGGLDLLHIADRDDASRDVETPDDLAWWLAATGGASHPGGDR